MQFLFQPLTWGFLLVGVPILVHLINMLRHRRQQWAAMDFLLESYRRNRRWVMLKQWLLLLARILVMLLLVAMLAQWVSSAQWLSWFGGQTTHHYILLDDSYSMRERDQTDTPYQRGLQAVAGLVRSISARPGQHQVTVMRLSRATLALQAEGQAARVDAAADLLGQSVPRQPERLLDRLKATGPVSLQLAPTEGLELLGPMIERATEQRSEVYLVTDVRRNEFGQPETLKNQLQSMAAANARIHLVDCGREMAGRNLSVVSLEPEQEVWAAGVPLMVRVQVRNRSLQTASNVVLRVRAISYPRGGGLSPDPTRPYSGDAQDLPPVVIENIQPGETVARLVQVVFPLPGTHAVEAALPEDVLADDNRRWCTVAVKDMQRVLAIDGAADQANAFFLEKALQPGGNLKTGMQVETRDVGFLRDAAPEVLAQYDAIALLDVPRLDPQAIDKLIDYCRGGGGLLTLAGPATNVEQINQQWYRDGEGLFPLPVVGVDQFDTPIGSEQPQVQAAEHTILAPLRRLETSPFLLLQIRKLLRVEIPEAPQRDVQLVAVGPGGRPLVIDSALGAGRVVNILTGLHPQWSNWAQDPTFVVLMLRSLGYLSSFRRAPTGYPVGAPIEMVVAGTSALPEAEVLVPAGEQGARLRIQRPVQIDDDSTASVRLEVGLAPEQRDLVEPLLRPGLFEVWMLTAQGEPLVECLAHNPSAAEGDLSRVERAELERKLAGVDYRFHTAESLAGTTATGDETSPSALVMALLGMLLLGEQVLAYSASFHPVSATSGQGGKR
ncbi:MAG: hypothetical protein D6753_09790 [Planctomycetota bacterium]|nr:MAG: hypothetical protein D6753_09790 [Planctomycetota bacterium]